MQTRFSLAAALLLTAGCAHNETIPETTATPTYRHEDLLEAAGMAGGHRNLEDRVATLEAQMAAVKVEVGRVSGATQRLEARQIQAVGVAPEPPSKAAAPLTKIHKNKADKAKASQTVTATADPRDPWIQSAPAPAETAAATPAPAADHPDHKDAAPAIAAAPAEHAAPAASTEASTKDTKAPAVPPAPHNDAKPAAEAQGAAGVGFALQLGAFGSGQRAASGWEELKARGGATLADLLPKREELSRDGKTLYRLKAGPLPDREAAAKRCDALKAQNIPCIVTLFSGDWPSS
jgi:septal ring-binding cell division protein DamX